MAPGTICGCYFTISSADPYRNPTKQYLPQVDLSVHSSILSTTSRTALAQTFKNPSVDNAIDECVYEFPLYDGVSVVGFTCRIGSRVIKGIVKEKEKARKVYAEAIERGETAGLLEQLDTSDFFRTKIGNIPAGEKVIVDVSYIGELKHDAETDGIRFTIPTVIAPRYGDRPYEFTHQTSVKADDGGGIRITVDVNLADGSFVRGIQSPSHPIAVTMGSTSTGTQEEPQMHTASATLALGSTELDKDFVLIVLAKTIPTPKALLETHLSIANQRALMVTLVPKFALPPGRPEIIFVVDRSGSMTANIPTLISALKVFLKSMPVGVKFNICSFGSRYSFLWPSSQSYSQDTLAEAIQHVTSFRADFGGTETFSAIKATIESRYKDIPLEVMLLTDGEIWNQQEIFSYLNNEVGNSEAPIRVFPLGIGNAVSHALIEGIARAGNGFAQSVGNDEKLDSKVVRMLKGGLSPHTSEYTLEVMYDKNDDGEADYDMVERVTDGLSVQLTEGADKAAAMDTEPKVFSLFDPSADPDEEEPPTYDEDGQSRYSHLPAIPTPSLLQAPHKIPPLFPFNRTTVYILMGPQSPQHMPKNVVLRAVSPHGLLELNVPVQALDKPGETIHQLAARKAVGDLEEGRGWISDARDETGTLIKERFPSCFGDMAEREAVRLGVQFQVGGKFCSFVAVEANNGEVGEIKELGTMSLQQKAERVAPGRSSPSPSPGKYLFSPDYTALSNLALHADRRMLTHSTAARRAFVSKRMSNQARSSAGGHLFSRLKRTPPASFPLSLGTSSSQPQPQASPMASPEHGAQYQSSFPTATPCAFSSPQSGQPASHPAASNPARTIGSVSMSVGTSQPQQQQQQHSYQPQYIRPQMRTSAPGPTTQAGIHSADHLSAYASALQKGASPRFMLARDAAPPFIGAPPQPPPVAVETAEETDVLYALIALQTFDGSWKFDEALLRVLQLDGVEAAKIVPRSVREGVWATVLAICFLERNMGDRKDAWELVAEKARGWIDALALGEGVVEELFDVTKGFWGQ